MALRSALHQAGALALNELLQHDPPQPSSEPAAAPVATPPSYRGLRAKTILTVLGAVEVVRPYFLCPHCHHGQFPADVDLDLEKHRTVAGRAPDAGIVGNDAPFDHGREQMKLLAGLEVTTKAVERNRRGDWCRYWRLPAAGDESGPAVGSSHPPRPPDSRALCRVRRHRSAGGASRDRGRQGKIDGQPAHTREAKLGCVFTQTTVDEDGYPVRDHASTTYTGAIETAEEFARRIYSEAWQRGWVGRTRRS